MAKLAMLVALIALGVAILAYRETGGTKDLSKAIEAIRQDLRQETADGLAKIEKVLRSGDAAKPKP